MDDVAVGERLVGGQRVGRFRHVRVHRLDPALVKVLARYRAGGLAGGEQPHLVTYSLPAPGQVVDAPLGPAVGGRRDRHPRRGDQADPHRCTRCIQPSSASQQSPHDPVRPAREAGPFPVHDHQGVGPAAFVPAGQGPCRCEVQGDGVTVHITIAAPRAGRWQGPTSRHSVAKGTSITGTAPSSTARRTVRARPGSSRCDQPSAIMSARSASVTSRTCSQAEPDDAADAVQDTFAIAAGKLGGLRDPRKLRPWLYAVARNECHRRRRGPETGLDEAADLADPAADISDSAERAELRRLVRAALAGLHPGEREALELSLRHDLDGADLAAVLGVSRNQAHALASSARGQLEKALGVLLVARTGRRACPVLDGLLADGDGRLTAHTRKEISRHIDQCEVCDNRRRGVLRPAALFGMAPLAALPRWLRGEVLRICGDDSDLTLTYRHEVMLRAGPLRPNGFPQAIREPRRRIVALTRIAAAAAIVIALASAGIISALALGGSPPPRSLAGARTSRGSATAGAAQ